MELNDFGFMVRMQLLKKGKSQKWLIEEVRKSTGLYLDSSYLMRILTGQRKPPKVLKAICEILEVEN